MRLIFVLVVVSTIAFVSPLAICTALYVAPPPVGSDANPGTEQQPFATVQKGIDAAANRDTVIVAPGTYFENLHFHGKNILLQSTNPTDADVVAGTIVDGSDAESVITFSGVEGDTCAVAGFTIRNGNGDFGGGICGGTTDDRTQATIRNNVIVANSATTGGGLAFCDGIIRENIVIENSSQSGGGLAFCDGTIRVNLIVGNFAGLGGGGLYECNGEIQNNTISGNLSDGGGGLYECNGEIQSNIIWGNMAWYGAQLHASTPPIYSCIQDWSSGGEGNISEDPQFMDPDGPDDNRSTHSDNDYRLSASSPCIDTGLNEDWMWDATDLDGNPRILYATSLLTVDMGAYEFVPFGDYNVLTVIVRNLNHPSRSPSGASITISPIVGLVTKPVFSVYLPAGTYEIHAEAPDFSADDRWTEVTAKSGATEFILLVPNAGSVSGMVAIAGDSIPISGASIELEITSGIFSGTTYGTSSDVDGSFTFADLPAAIDFKITVSKAGYFKHQMAFYLKAGEKKELGDIHIVPSVTISREAVGSFTVTWVSISGGLYNVYYAERVGEWSLAASAIPASGTGIDSWTDDNASGTTPPPADARSRFYRIEAY